MSKKIKWSNRLTERSSEHFSAPFVKWVKQREAAAYINRITKERDEARNELERERMRLAACGVVALSNTPESAMKNRDMHPDYRSASCDDVAKAVDMEIQLRKERDEAQECLREMLSQMSEYGTRWFGGQRESKWTLATCDGDEVKRWRKAAGIDHIADDKKMAEDGR